MPSRLIAPHPLTRPVTVGQVLVEEVRLGGQQVIEGEGRVTVDPHANDAYPEARHRLVVAVGVAMVRGKSPDSAGNGIGGLLQAKPAYLNPRQAKVIAVVEVLISNLARFKRGKELLVGRRDARLSL